MPYGVAAAVQRGSPQVDLTHGLIDFGTNPDGAKYYSIPHDSILDLGAGAWAIGAWTNVTGNGGTNFQYLLSTGALGATPSLQLYLNEDSVATHNGKWQNRTLDDAGVDTTSSSRSSTAPGADSTPRLIVFQSTGTTIEIWFSVAGSATRVLNQATDLGALTAPDIWNLGRRSDGATGRGYENQAGGLFFATVSMDETTIEAIDAAGEPVSVLGGNCAEYWRFAAGAGATEVGVVAATVATRVGTWT